MSDVERHEPGTFCWTDLAAHDPEAAKRFYTAFFGWEAVDNRYGPGEGDVYTMHRLRGRNAAASYAMDAEQKAAGIPPYWLCYVAVESADASAARARELGATLIVEPFDVMGHGRMALLADPTGSVLALWEARSHPGADVWHEPGSVIWNELATHDPAKAEAFYTELFGWEARTMDFGPAVRYTEFHHGDAPVAGMYAIQPGMEGMPAVWMPYFGTDDPDGDAPRAVELGAEVVQGPADVPGVGRFVLLRDPQGALFYAMRLDAWEQS